MESIGEHLPGKLYRSDDAGQTIAAKTNGIDSNDAYWFQAPFVVDPSAPGTVFFGTDRVYRTTDRGEHWVPISPHFEVLLHLAVAPTSSATIYAAPDSGVVRFTHDGGGYWSGPGPDSPYCPIRDLVVDPNDPRTAYFTCQDHRVHRTRNGGGTWEDVSGNLPTLPVNALAMDGTASPATLYVGTDAGVWRSVDDAASWEPFEDGLPHAAVMDLVLNARTGVLVAATHGRGMFVSCDGPCLFLCGNGELDVGEQCDPPGEHCSATCQLVPACVGDCGGNSTVTVDELLTMVNIALGNAEVSACEAGDVNGDGQITVDEILTAVPNALNGCG
jgi:photosystem II stability/assembly factor-like uncharacterized protein